MNDELKQLKFYLSSFHKNCQTHLWFDKINTTWYFVTNIHGDAWTGEIKDTHTVIVKMNINGETFSEIFQSTFQPLFEKINYEFDHYLFDVKLLNRFINSALKGTIDPLLLNDSCVVYSRRSISEWMSVLINKFPLDGSRTESFLDEYKRNPDLSFLNILINDKKFHIPIKSGITFIHPSVLGELQNVLINYTLYKFSDNTITYSYTCTSDENSFTFYQPFRIFV